MSTLILGIGNPILTDDRVGIEIAHKIKEDNSKLEVIETSEAGISLLDLVVGYDKLIIIDSIPLYVMVLVNPYSEKSQKGYAIGT